MRLQAMLLVFATLCLSLASAQVNFDDLFDDQISIDDILGDVECIFDIQCPAGQTCVRTRCVCFAPDSMVVTQQRGAIPMHELAVDDEVLTANGGFSKVYGFHHRTPASSVSTPSNYLRIQVESGEEITMTPRHMIFLATQSFPVEASQVKIGDYMIIQKENAESVTSQVVEVKSVKIKGGYSPLTVDGTIVVDGMAASCYANPSYSKSDEYVKIAGLSVIHRHLFTHILFSPARLFCEYVSDGPCKATASTAEETKITGDVWMHEMYEMAVELGVLDLGLVFAGALASIFYVLECIISTWALTFAALAILALAVGKKWSSQDVKKKHA